MNRPGKLAVAILDYGVAKEQTNGFCIRDDFVCSSHV